jgi:hypothetical protein
MGGLSLAHAHTRARARVSPQWQNGFHPPQPPKRNKINVLGRTQSSLFWEDGRIKSSCPQGSLIDTPRLNAETAVFVATILPSSLILPGI